MTIFINGRFMTQSMSGVQRYAAHIVAGLDRIAGRGGAKFELLCPPGAATLALGTIEQRVVGRSSGHLWEQWDFARAARDGVALSLAMSGPVRHRRQLVVIHDAAVHRHPRHFSFLYALGHRLLERRLARHASIATVSAFSQAELATVLGIPAARIAVAPNGVDHVGTIQPSDIVDLLQLGGRPFFLMVGNLTPNKNLGIVLRALRRLPQSDVRLVAVGATNKRVFGGRALPHDPRLVLTGRLDDRDVRALMAGARALIFPSHYEGFGLPPIEAMASGCPVIASDIGAVREVCGAAAALFDPDDERVLARHMVTALTDDGRWRAERIAAGRARVPLYCWDRAAATIADACQSIAEPSPCAF